MFLLDLRAGNVFLRIVLSWKRITDLAFPQWADFEPLSSFRAPGRQKGKEDDSGHRN